MTTFTTRLSQTFAQLKHAWADIDHAQRRLLDFELGVPPHEHRIRGLAGPTELDA